VIIDPMGVLADVALTHQDVSYIPMGRART
jgi:hypothetical protein